jgi:tRNA pseudouridine38-40 synthase
MTMKYKITLEYDGTNYSGWQTQKNAKSIQEKLINAAAELLECDVDIQGSGRTDAGVHALGQVAHLVTSKKMMPTLMLDGLNSLLPSNINVLNVEEAPISFHARHSAKARSYIYLISKCRTAFGKRFVWWVKDPLNFHKMQSAIELFLNFHDFTSFVDKRRDKDLSSTVMIHSINLTDYGSLIVLRIIASHFLWKMVRRVTGILVEAGKGNISKSAVEDLLVNKSDMPAKFTAPPSGLFLEKVFYEGDQLKTVSTLPLAVFIGNHQK